jgi:hypothetical protein
MSDCIDIHAHIVPEKFPAYAGRGRDVSWPAMAERIGAALPGALSLSREAVPLV